VAELAAALRALLPDGRSDPTAPPPITGRPGRSTCSDCGHSARAPWWPRRRSGPPAVTDPTGITGTATAGPPGVDPADPRLPLRQPAVRLGCVADGRGGLVRSGHRHVWSGRGEAGLPRERTGWRRPSISRSPTSSRCATRRRRSRPEPRSGWSSRSSPRRALRCTRCRRCCRAADGAGVRGGDREVRRRCRQPRARTEHPATDHAAPEYPALRPWRGKCAQHPPSW